MSQILIIIFSTLVVYLFIITAIRVFGKREISQLSVIDLVFILLISNAVQNAMVGGDWNMLIGGLVAAATLFIANNFLGELFFKSKKFSKLVQGEPIILIHKGEVIKANLDKAKITQDELDAAIREHGVESEKEVDLAMLERDGNISVMSDNYKHQTTKKRHAHRAVAEIN
jgi:uncharacterized membrane protein YcaP (DUF421 family)